MKKPLSLLAALCLGGILAFGTAQASPYYYTNIITQTVTNNVYGSWQDFVFNKYNVDDPVKGGLMDLLGVTVSVDYSYLTGDATVSNTSPTRTLTIDSFSSAFGVKTNSLGYTPFTNTIASVGTTPDWSGISLAPSGSSTLTLNPGQYFVSSPNVQSISSSLFNLYTGVGTLAFSLRNVQTITTAGGSYNVDTDLAGSLASMTVTYTYGVPEPSTYILFGLGGLALVVAYRRKRSA